MNEHQFKISTNDINELRRQLLEFAVAEQLDIVSLQTEGNNLEDIFRNLTTQNLYRFQKPYRFKKLNYATNINTAIFKAIEEK